jgi:enoyl-CoA hydratase
MQCFTLNESNHIAHLVLNKPDSLNTMHPQFWRELDETLAAIQRAGTARALVISSTGKHFSAGMALETFSSAIQMDDASASGRAAIFDMLTDMQATFTKLETLRIPVIAAIQGGCIGGAVDMVTACCLRYASADAFFCIQEINIGMVADVGTLQRLPKLIPEAVVKEYAYTGRRMPAAKALAYGLVNEVCATPEEVLAAAMQCASEIAAKPPVAIWGTKQAIHYTRDHSVEDALKQMGCKARSGAMRR